MQNKEEILKSDTRPVRVMFEDEGRFGLIDNPRDCWAPAGIRPECRAQIVREYTYSFAAVSPVDGVLDSLILPHANTEAMSYYLGEISRRHEDEFVIMFCDGAGWHKANDLIIPENMKLLPTPPYSPELNPAEHIWKCLRENFMGNRKFRSMKEVEDSLCEGLINLENDQRRVKSMTGFNWILDSI